MKRVLPPPAPMTCHPTYAHYANTIRDALHQSDTIVIAATPTTPEHRLDTAKHLAPAPYVGDHARTVGYYVWRSATDSLGRSVAGEARLGIQVLLD